LKQVRNEFKSVDVELEWIIYNYKNILTNKSSIRLKEKYKIRESPLPRGGGSVAAQRPTHPCCATAKSRHENDRSDRDAHFRVSRGARL
jgi:hypothetical protein